MNKILIFVFPFISIVSVKERFSESHPCHSYIMTSRAKADKKSNNGEDFEVLDVRDAAAKEAESLVRAIQQYVRQGSNGRQLAIGGVSGWLVWNVIFVNRFFFHI